MRGEPELFHQRLGAMMADAHRDLVLVEHGADIVRVHAVEVERENRRAAAGRPPTSCRPGMRDSRSTAVAGQRLLVLAGSSSRPISSMKSIASAEPDRAGDVRGAGLEAVRRLLELGLLEGDVEDHARRRPCQGGIAASSS